MGDARPTGWGTTGQSKAVSPCTMSGALEYESHLCTAQRGPAQATGQPLRPCVSQSTHGTPPGAEVLAPLRRKAVCCGRGLLGAIRSQPHPSTVRLGACLVKGI